ncbi:MAG: 23S rRNA (adenine(2503)-C(2))-methyltransferase RlmN [Puniceicoccaceae bacterium]
MRKGQAFQPLKTSLLGFSRDELVALIEELGQPAFRAKQLEDWIYKQGVNHFGKMANLPAGLRSALDERFSLRSTEMILKKRSGDTTIKYLSKLEDGSMVETVLINAPQVGVGQEQSRNTVCVSSQVGCAYGCKFCASGLRGLKRDLTAGEILSQFFEIRDDPGADQTSRRADHLNIDNIVFMGMGEPLANYDAVVRALRALTSEWGFNLGARRITVSTSGLVPEIRQLADEGLGVRLAVSLHGATNEVRGKIMPINRRYPIEALIPAIEYFQQKHKRMVTLEYILIDEINDDFGEADALVAIAQRLHVHINCIPYNRVDGLQWRRPSLTRQDAFVQRLRARGLSVTIRREKGHDIAAACGQLRLQEEGKLPGGLPVGAVM